MLHRFFNHLFHDIICKSSMDENKVTYFAETDARGKRVRFGIKNKDRSRHIYVIGKTGMGKSTLLENMAIQDIQNGNGLAFIDPHGKTAELLLDYIPKERIKDVIYFAPFDLSHPISFNVMEDVGYDKRHLVVSGLMSAFKKIWVDAWSGRMEYILSNTLLALLEYPDATLLGVNRMLVDKDYRKEVVAHITDPTVKAFWVNEFAKYTDRYTQEATPAIQNKVGQFTSNPLIRNIIGQPKSSFDLRQTMDDKKIFIVNLSKGRMGEVNADLLGSMLVTKIYLAAMSRADTSEEILDALPYFYLYADEFQSFANESFADILSEARKYKLSLTIAHQYIEQVPEEVRSAVFGNVGTMAVFRVGAFDAEVLEKEFAPVFTMEDLVNLGFVQIYLKLMVDGITSQPFSAVTLPPIQKPEISYKDEIIEFSRATYAQPRELIEKNIKLWHEPVRVERDVLKEKLRPPASKEFIEEKTVISKKELKTPLERSTNSANFSSLDVGKDVAYSMERVAQKNKFKKAASPSKESKNELREALSGLLSADRITLERKENIVKNPQNKNQTETATKQLEPEVSTPGNNKTGFKAPPEIPEDVLKKILDVEQ